MAERIPEVAPVRTRGAYATHRGAQRAHDDQAVAFLADPTRAFASVVRGWIHASPGRRAAELILDTGVRIFRELTASMLDDLAEVWWKAEHEGARVRPFASLPIADRAELRTRVRRLLAERVADALGDQAVLEGETKRLLEMPALALARAGNELERKMERERHGWAGAGGTAISAVFAAGQVSIAHLGDCRAYRLRRAASPRSPDRFDALTRPHDLQRDYDAAAVVSAKGPERLVAPVTQGDLYLFVTKGVVDAFDDAALKRALAANGVEAAQTLVSEGATRASENVAAVAVEVL